MKLNFKRFLTEDEARSLKKDKGEEENYLQGMNRELGIDPNSITEFIESGPIEISDEGLFFNQAIWKIIKPLDINDKFARIQFHKSLSPSLNQHCYRRRDDGKMEPAQENLTGRIFLIPLKKLADMLGKPWQSAGGAGGGGMGAGPI